MIDKIKKYDLCLGCGLCASVLGKEKCQMELNNKGFYEPIIHQPLSAQENKCIRRLCPGVRVETKAHSGVWGAMKSICEAWSADQVIRHKAASGGVVTSLCLYLLEHNKVDAVLQVGVRNDSYIYNELHVSRTREEILKNAQSRYAPSLTFNRIKEIMDSGDCTVKVYSSKDSWYGVTYREDRDSVVNSLAALKADGTYPNKLNESI